MSGAWCNAKEYNGMELLHFSCVVGRVCPANAFPVYLAGPQGSPEERDIERSVGRLLDALASRSLCIP